ncbi:MAG TPA: VWA domain-containing protein [Mycobacteriales bacterium]|jgi:hypothetical protein
MGDIDLATGVARFGAALRAAGLPVGPDRSARFARAIAVARPRTTTALHQCGLATLVSDPDHIATFDAVFAAVFGGATDPAEHRGDPTAPRPTSAPSAATQPAPAPGGSAEIRSASTGDDGTTRPVPLRAYASGDERLSGRDFADLSPDELAVLARLMRDLKLATPPRQSARYRRTARGHRIDLRTTLRQARRTGGDPLRISRRTHRQRPRRMVVLCDISASMEAYSRAMLQLLYCAAGGAHAEVFTFATRLTRLTRELHSGRPGTALERAGRAAPDWSGGTRIGAALADFNDRYGCRGMARGAVVLIVSDGWETGDPAQLGREMARLSRVAYRIVWANPRTQSPRYRPLVGGMAAAWPYCDAVVSAHSLSALTDLIEALADPVHSRRGTPPCS